jgi:hypothetical protein
MKYRLYAKEPIPLKVPEGHVMSGTLCDFESQAPINRGDKISLDTNDERLNNLNVQEVEVVQNPRHIIKEGQITFSVLTVKKID